MPVPSLSKKLKSHRVDRKTEQWPDAGQEILRAATITEACQRLTACLTEISQSKRISILLRDQDQKYRSLWFENGAPVEALDPAVVSLLESGLNQVLPAAPSTLAPGEETHVLIPLVTHERVIGAILVSGLPGRSKLTQADLDLMASLAAMAAAGIETARLYQEDQERRRVAEALINAGRNLSGNLKPAEVPGRILEQLALVVPYERGSLLLQEGNSLRISAQRGFPKDERTERLSIPLREGDVYLQIVATCHPVLIDDVTQTPGWQQVSWLPLNHSWLGVPLFSSDRVIGMVSLTRSEKGAFSHDDIVLASTFALQAAVAIENAALYEEITRFNEQLEQMVQQRTEELRTALDALERMDKNKSDFIKVAAHELRTPLTIMKGYMGMLQNDASVKASSYLGQAVDGVLKGTDRLYEIINSMLDAARIDNQVLDLRLEPVSITPIIKRIQADYSPFLEERHLTLVVEDLRVLPKLNADSTLLLKVFQNVVLNAIKYTPDGGAISISGNQVQDEQLGPCVEFLVRDNGIGIDPEFHELIFEKFYRTGAVALHSSGKTTFKGGGPGLGLAIARGIVQAHNGRIWVESERQDESCCPGSCFHILIPASVD